MDFVLYLTPLKTVFLFLYFFFLFFKEALLPGAGAFEIAAYCMLQKEMNQLKGRAKLGALAYANALLIVPKTLAINCGYDAQESIVKLVEATQDANDMPVGLDLESGEPFHPVVRSYNISVIGSKHISYVYAES